MSTYRQTALPGIFLGMLLLLGSFAGGVRAQGTGPVLSILQVEDAHYPEIRVALAATGADGNPLRGLTRDNFLVAEDGGAVQIEMVSEPAGNLPMHLALALDTSSSMQGSPWRARNQAVTALIQSLAPSDLASIVTFNNRASTLAPLSADHAGTAAALRNMRSGGSGSVLYDAAQQALTAVQSAPAGRRAVILFTDGQDTGSSQDLEGVIEAAQRSAIPLYVIGYGPNINPATLQRMATSTGGAFFRAQSIQEISPALVQVMLNLRQTYELTYLAAAQADGAEHQMQVTLVTPGGSSVVTRPIVAYPGNLAVTLALQEQPDRAAVERMWNVLGKGPIDAEASLASGLMTLVGQISGPGRITSAEVALDGAQFAEIGGLTPAMPGAAAGIPMTETAPTSVTVPLVASMTLSTTKPFSYTWDTTAVEPGVHTLAVTLTDHVGNQASGELPVAVAPAVTFVLPAEGDIVSDTVPIEVMTATASPVTEIVLAANDDEITRFASEPYAFDWITWQSPSGAYQLLATMAMSNGTTLQATRNITVGPHVAVRLIEPSANDTLEGSVTLSATANSDAPITEVVFFVNDQEVGRSSGPPYEAELHTGDFTPGSYRLRAEAHNRAGMTASSEVQASMVPATRTGAPAAALIGALALMLIVPMVFVARRRRTNRQPGLDGSGNISATPVITASTGDQPIAWLIPAADADEKSIHPLHAGENSIGRNREFADVWLSDTGVSRRHAILRLTPDKAEYVDLSPDNPSMHNERPVVGTAELHDGDRLQIGRMVFIFSYQRGG